MMDGITPVGNSNEWRNHTSTTRTVRRSASTPPRPRPALLHGGNNTTAPVSVHRATDKDVNTPSVQDETNIGSTPQDILQQTTAVVVPDKERVGKSVITSDLESIENLLSETIKELSKELDGTVEKNPGNTVAQPVQQSPPITTRTSTSGMNNEERTGPTVCRDDDYAPMMNEPNVFVSSTPTPSSNDERTSFNVEYAVPQPVNPTVEVKYETSHSTPTESYNKKPYTAEWGGSSAFTVTSRTVLTANDSKNGNSSYSDYDVLPHPTPVVETALEQRPVKIASRGLARQTNVERPRHVVTTVRQKCAEGKTLHRIETKRADSAFTNNGSSTSGATFTRPQPPNTLSLDKKNSRDEGNNTGRVIISWNDGGVLNKPNTVDASLSIGTGTVASRVNIFDVKQQQSNKPCGSDVSDVKKVTNNLNTPTSIVGSAEQSGSSSQHGWKSSGLFNGLQRNFDTEVSHEVQKELPSNLTAFMPPPPASWRFSRQIDTEQRSSPKSASIVKNTDDMLKFKVDQQRAPLQEEQKNSMASISGSHVIRTNNDRRDKQVVLCDLNAIASKLERLIFSIDRQNKNIQSISQMLNPGRSTDTCNHGVYYPPPDHDKEYYYKADAPPSSLKSSHTSLEDTKGKQPQKGDRVKLLSCIRK